MYKFARKVLLGKIEGTYGTDSTPAAGTDAILAYNGEIRPLEQTYVERRPMRPFLGPESQLVDGRMFGITFDVHAAGGGAVDTPVPYGAFLRACALAETINATTDVQYDPVSASEESATAYWYQAGSLHKGVGLRGNAEFIVDSLDVPRFRFTMTGLYQDVASQALPSPDFSAFQTPLVASKANTPTFTLHGFAGKLAALNLNLGNDVQYRNLVGSESVDNVDRAASGSITIESPDVSTKDFFAIAKAGTTGALQVIHGATAGNIVQVDASAVQLTNPRYSNRNGVTMLDMDLYIVPDSGDDEIKITTK